MCVLFACIKHIWRPCWSPCVPAVTGGQALGSTSSRPPPYTIWTLRPSSAGQTHLGTLSTLPDHLWSSSQGNDLVVTFIDMHWGGVFHNNCQHNTLSLSETPATVFPQFWRITRNSFLLVIQQIPPAVDTRVLVRV